MSSKHQGIRSGSATRGATAAPIAPTTSQRARRIAAIGIMSVLAVAAIPARAETVTADSLYHFRSRDIGLTGQIADILVFGAFDVRPSAGAGTTGTYSQGDASGALHGLSFNPNLLENFVGYDPALTGSWELTFRNGADTTVVHTNPLLSLSLMPFAESIAVSGPGNTPLLHWQVPTGATFDRQSIFVMTRPPSSTSYDILHEGQVTNDTRTYRIPDGLLQDGQEYRLAINIWDASNSQRSLSAVSYTPLASTTGDTSVFLPTSMSDDAGNPFFSFQPIPVVAGETIHIDPLIAVGYDYAVRAGDPLFASVLLPENIGDGTYELRFTIGGDATSTIVAGGTPYLFPGTGVGAFTVLGIEPDAALDPADGTAFVTALTFAGSGVFAGTMTPITVQVPVPEPGTYALFGLGLAGIAFARTRRRVAARGRMRLRALHAVTR